MNDVDVLIAKDQIASRIYQLFISTDQRDWAEVRRCFADAVHFDMSSLGGGPASTLAPDQIVDMWAAGLGPIEHVHHQAGNLQISMDGSRAAAFCYGIALHYRKIASGNNLRRFIGSYDFALEHTARGWVISSFRFNVKFVDGNLELEK